MAKERKTLGKAISLTLRHDGVIEFVFTGVTHGATRLEFDYRKASLENQVAAMQKAFANRLIDLAALERDSTTGASATVDAKRDEIAKGIAWYESKDSTTWRIGGEAATGAGRRDTEAGLIILAVMRQWGDATTEAAEARIERFRVKRGLADRKTALGLLGKVPEVVARIGEIKAERAAAARSVNAEDVLADMGDDGDEPREMGDAPF